MCISLAVEGAIKWLFFTLDDQISENMFIVVGTNLCQGPGKFINDYVIIDFEALVKTQMFNEEMTWPSLYLMTRYKKPFLVYYLPHGYSCAEWAYTLNPICLNLWEQHNYESSKLCGESFFVN